MTRLLTAALTLAATVAHAACPPLALEHDLELDVALEESVLITLDLRAGGRPIDESGTDVYLVPRDRHGWVRRRAGGYASMPVLPGVYDVWYSALGRSLEVPDAPVGETLVRAGVLIDRPTRLTLDAKGVRLRGQVRSSIPMKTSTPFGPKGGRLVLRRTSKVLGWSHEIVEDLGTDGRFDFAVGPGRYDVEWYWEDGHPWEASLCGGVRPCSGMPVARDLDLSEDVTLEWDPGLVRAQVTARWDVGRWESPQPPRRGETPFTPILAFERREGGAAAFLPNRPDFTRPIQPRGQAGPLLLPPGTYDLRWLLYRTRCYGFCGNACSHDVPDFGPVVRGLVVDQAVAERGLAVDVPGVTVRGRVRFHGASWPVDTSGGLTFVSPGARTEVQVGSKDGHFESPLLPGTYDVWWTTTGSRCGSAREPPCGAGRVLSGITIDRDTRLEVPVGRVRLSGRVVGHRPVPAYDFGSVRLRPFGDAPGAPGWDMPVDRGRFAFRVVPGRYALDWSRPTGRTLPVVRDLDATRSQSVLLDGGAERTFRIRGRVTWPWPTPRGGYRVEAIDAETMRTAASQPLAQPGDPIDLHVPARPFFLRLTGGYHADCGGTAATPCNHRFDLACGD